MTLKQIFLPNRNRRRSAALCLMIFAASLAAGITAQAQSGDKFKARLAPAPRLVMDGQRSTNVPAGAVVGVGSATAVLSGRKLTITGSFEKLASKATAAHVFLGPATGVRDQGKPAFDLAVSKQQSAPAPPSQAPAARGQQPQQQPAEPGMVYSGAIEGSVELTPAQVEALKKGRFYIQIHSEGMPSGHLLGWLLK